MGIGSGLGGQFGMSAEVTYGTLVTPARFLEFNTESFKTDLAQLESRGIGTGRYLKPSRHKSYIKGAAGSIEFDVMTLGFGLPLKMALGGNTVTQVSSSSEYKHLIQPAATGLAGLMSTMQIGRPSIDGTVRPYNFLGCKVVDWELKADLDDWLKLVLGIDAKSVETSTALASASFASGAEPFTFAEGALTINGAAISVRNFSIKGHNALKTDRRYIGNTKAQPLANGEWTVMGTLGFEFEALTRYAALVAGTEQADLVITLDTGLAIPSGVANYRIVITVKAFFYQDGQPAIGGPDVLQETLTFKALDDGTNPIVKIEYYTTDTAA